MIPYVLSCKRYNRCIKVCMQQSYENYLDYKHNQKINRISLALALKKVLKKI